MKIKQLTPEESWTIFEKLPDSIQNIIESNEGNEINNDLLLKFKLNGHQHRKLVNIYFLIYGRILPLTELGQALSSEIYLDEKATKQLALEIAQKKLWLMKDYIGGVEKLIKTLGGELPKKIIKPIAEQEAPKKTAPQDKEINKEQATENIIQQNIKTVLNENSDAQEQLITSENILLTNSGEIHKSSIKYWLMEYMQTLGAGYHSNLDRIGFLYNNPNAKKLSAEERLVLGAVLKSYDDGDTLPFSETTGRLLIDKLKQ